MRRKLRARGAPALLAGLLLAACQGSGRTPAPDPSRSGVVASATHAAADGSDAIAVSVRVRDPAGHGLVGVEVTARADHGGAKVTPTAATTLLDGTTAFSVVCTAVAEVTVEVEAGGVVLDDRPVLTFEADPSTLSASASSVTAAPTTGVLANGIDQSTLTVTVVDGTGHPLAGQDVVLTADDGTPRILPGTVTTGDDGTATATVDCTAAGTYTFTATAYPTTGGTVVLDDRPTVTFVGDPSTLSASLSSVSASPTSGLVANGTDSATITVTARDALGNPLAGLTVQLAASGGSGAVITQPTATTDADGRATGSLAATSAATYTVTATVDPSGRNVTVNQTADVTFDPDSLTTDDTLLLYAEDDPSTVRHRERDHGSGSWSLESTATRPGETVPWIVAAIAPTIDATELALVLRDDGATPVLEWRRSTGSGWTLDAGTSGVPVAPRAFDLAFEQSSGDALAVWADGDATPSYRTWNGTSWSAAQALPLNDGTGSLPDPNSGAVTWVELAAEPGTDTLALAYADANADLVALLWDGGQWTTATAATLETDLKRNTSTGTVANRVFDLAFESSSGDLLAAWGVHSANGFDSAVLADGATSWTALSAVAVPASSPHFVDLAAEPASDRVAAVFLGLGDGNERMALAIWTGSGWTDAAEVDSQIHNVNDKAVGAAPGAVAWLGTTGTAVCVYADHDTGSLDEYTWTASGGWVASSDTSVSGKGFTESVHLLPATGDATCLALVSDNNGLLWALERSGGSWSVENGGNALENLLPDVDAVPFGAARR